MERRMKMRRAMMLCAAVLCLTMTLAPTALAAGTNEVEICYPTAITQSEDGTELRKLYDLGPEDDPTGIPRAHAVGSPPAQSPHRTRGFCQTR